MTQPFGTLTRIIEDALHHEIRRTLRTYHGNTLGRTATHIDFDVACYWIEFTDGSASEYAILYNLDCHDLHADNYLHGIWQLPTKHDIPTKDQHSRQYRNAQRWPERK